ncbi:MAG: DUF4330 domain-containing protein, partial [Cyanobacteria bacterium J06648_11]
DEQLRGDDMAVIDRQGRLFGKVSVLDLGALAVVLVAIFAVFLFPNDPSAGIPLPGTSRTTEPVEVDMVVRGISTRSTDIFKAGEKANVIIRNQPYGQVEIVNVEDVTRRVPVVFPDGTLERVEGEDEYRADVVLTIGGQARVTNDSIILGNTPVKVGVPLEVETFDYLLRGSVMNVRRLENTSIPKSQDNA